MVARAEVGEELVIEAVVVTDVSLTNVAVFGANRNVVATLLLAAMFVKPVGRTEKLPLFAGDDGATEKEYVDALVDTTETPRLEAPAPTSVLSVMPVSCLVPVGMLIGALLGVVVVVVETPLTAV
jgi:hypothetical protein